MEIREIQAADTYEIRHEVMWPDKPFDFVKMDEDTEGVHLGLFEGDLLISIVSLFFKNKEMQFRKFATLIDYQGHGYGTILLNYAFQLSENQKITRIWCNARSNKSAFYKKMGMTETDARYSKGGMDFVIMEKQF